MWPRYKNYTNLWISLYSAPLGGRSHCASLRGRRVVRARRLPHALHWSWNESLPWQSIGRTAQAPECAKARRTNTARDGKVVLMNAKPLSQKERAEIERLLRLNQSARHGISGHGICDIALMTAMAAEQYWRERCGKLDPTGRGIIKVSDEF